MKQCIKLIETRGISLNMSIRVKMLLCPVNFLLPSLFLCEGLTTPGLYRTGGVNSKVQRLMTTVFGENLCAHLSVRGSLLHNNNLQSLC